MEKHVLAAYYNDARLNILACLNDIRIKTGRKEEKNEDQIRSAFSGLGLSGGTPEQQDELIRHLRHRFGFLDVLTNTPPPVAPKRSHKQKMSAEEKKKWQTELNAHEEKKQRWKENLLPLPNYYEAHLNWMLELINGLRNSMTHPTDAEISISYSTHRRLYHALRKIYDSSFHTIKNRFGHDTATMASFKRCGSDGAVLTPEEFSLALCLDPRDADKIGSLPQSEILYDFGHIMFCSLFLDKAQSAELINYFWQTEHGESWGGSDQRSIIREMITVYRLRLPLQRLQSDKTPVTVTMDTLSELSRCPRPLLDMLSPEDQNRFRGETGEPEDNKPENEQQEQENKKEDTYLFARSRQDRFVPLIMRFFDFDNKSRIRFAVDLGQFYFNVRLKPASEFTDGQPRVRRLGQKILGYGRLLDYETAEKPHYWRQLEKNYQTSREEEKEQLENAGPGLEQLKPYIVQTYPHYHYFDDKIGFRITPDRNDSKVSYPVLTTQDVTQAGALTRPKARDMQPHFWMSQGQMLQLAFYNHLQQDNERYQALHHLLNRYRSGIKSLMLDLRAGEVALAGAPRSMERRAAAQQWIDQHFDHQGGVAFQVSLSDLPKVVIHYLLDDAERQVNVTDVMDRARHLLERTEARQRRLLEQLRMADKKPGAKGFKAIKCGPIGDFLAEDLMRFQPVDPAKLDTDGGKINSQQYQILQKVLAYYGAHIEGKDLPHIVDLLRDTGLLPSKRKDNKFPHPFIGKLNLENQPDRYKGLLDFYQAYLEKRKEYLKQWIREHENSKTLDQLPQWLRMRTPSSISNWLDEQLDENGKLIQPTPLANNMLYKPILEMVAKTLTIDPQALEKEGAQRFQRNGETVTIPPSVTWLLKRYLQGKNDQPQSMYSEYPRHHNVFDTWLDRRTRRQRFREKARQYLTEAERLEYTDDIRQFVDKYFPDNEHEVERIRKAMSKPQSREAGSDVAKAIKLKGLLRGYKRDMRKVQYSVSQDMLLYLAATRHLSSLMLSDGENQAAWSLHGIEKDILNYKIDHQLEVPGTDKILEHPDCRIRDRGELTLLVRDRRLKTLLAYYNPEETMLHHTEIRYELNAYRRAKVAIMELVHQLEKKIIAVLGDIPRRDKELEKQTKRYFGKGRHGDFLHALHLHYKEHSNQHSAAFDQVCFKRALQIRNAFSHNAYPDVTQFINIASQVQTEAPPEEPTRNRKVAERLQLEMDALYQPWLGFLEPCSSTSTH